MSVSQLFIKDDQKSTLKLKNKYFFAVDFVYFFRINILGLNL
jgi:hypothetical protein